MGCVCAQLGTFFDVGNCIYELYTRRFGYRRGRQDIYFFNKLNVTNDPKVDTPRVHTTHMHTVMCNVIWSRLGAGGEGGEHMNQPESHIFTLVAIKLLDTDTALVQTIHQILKASSQLNMVSKKKKVNRLLLKKRYN